MEKKKKSLGEILGVIGVVIALIVSIVNDAPFLGAILCMFLLFIGNAIGETIEKFMQKNADRKNLAKELIVSILLIALLLFGFNACTAGNGSHSSSSNSKPGHCKVCGRKYSFNWSDVCDDCKWKADQGWFDF